MSKINFDKKETRNTIKTAITELSELVRSTLGPGGSTVMVRMGVNTLPHVTKDGATAARNWFTGVPHVDLVGKLFKEAALNVEQQVGDGTTTTTVLTAELLKLTELYINEPDYPSYDATRPTLRKRKVFKELDDFASSFKTLVQNSSTKVIEKEDVFKVALVSTNGDVKMSTLIADIIEASGSEGIVNVREGNDVDQFFVRNGLPIDMQVVSEHYLYGAEEAITVESPYVYIINRPLVENDIELLINTINTGASVVLVATDYEGMETRLNTLNQQLSNSRNKLVVLRASTYGKARIGAFNDICHVINAEVNSNDKDIRTGWAVSVTASKATTAFEHNMDVTPHVNSLKELRNACTNNYDNERLTIRINRLLGGVVDVLVGGDTQLELTERKDRVDDAVLACQAALRGGVVKGGGYSYLTTMFNEDDTAFNNAVANPLSTAIIERVMLNDNYTESEINEVISAFKDSGIYYDLNSETYTKDYTIVDPALTSIYAVETAVSLVKLALGSDNIIMGNPAAMTSFT